MRANGLVVGRENGFAPGEIDGIAFADGAEIGGGLGEFERWRERGTCLGATGQQQAKAGQSEKISRREGHAKGKSIRGWQYPVLSTQYPEKSATGVRCWSF